MPERGAKPASPASALGLTLPCLAFGVQSVKEVVEDQLLRKRGGRQEAIGEHVNVAVGLLGNGSRQVASALKLDQAGTARFQILRAAAQRRNSAFEGWRSIGLGREKLSQMRRLALISTDNLRFQARIGLQTTGNVVARHLERLSLLLGRQS